VEGGGGLQQNQHTEDTHLLNTDGLSIHKSTRQAVQRKSHPLSCEMQLALEDP
jgi:hypothetical protein